MVNVYVPATTEVLGVSVSVEVPVGVTLAGDQAGVTPVGTPVTDIVTEELKPCSPATLTGNVMAPVL